jgi:predicted nucleic acid-binding protein
VNALVLDAGAFIALERHQPDVMRRLLAAQRNGIDLRTSAIVLGQVWRGGGGKQTAISRMLASVEVLPVTTAVGQATGVLTGRAGTNDPIDAAVVLAAEPGDVIITSDPVDIEHLVAMSGGGVVVLSC